LKKSDKVSTKKTAPKDSFYIYNIYQFPNGSLDVNHFEHIYQHIDSLAVFEAKPMMWLYYGIYGDSPKFTKSISPEKLYLYGIKEKDELSTSL